MNCTFVEKAPIFILGNIEIREVNIAEDGRYFISAGNEHYQVEKCGDGYKAVTEQKVPSKRELKVKFLRLLADHFESQIDASEYKASADYRIRENCGGAENGSYIHIDIFHYGIENYYGKEIADLYNKIMEANK